ncbi:hypothetical protein Tco_0105739 [Tanacetum coccineum]
MEGASSCVRESLNLIAARSELLIPYIFAVQVQFATTTVFRLRENSNPEDAGPLSHTSPLSKIFQAVPTLCFGVIPGVQVIDLLEARGLSNSRNKYQQIQATIRHSSSALHAISNINSGVVSSLATRKMYVHGQLRTISTLSTLNIGELNTIWFLANH